MNVTYKQYKSKRKSFSKLIRNNFFAFVIISSIGFVGLMSIYKLFAVQPTYVYAKIKVGQGMWWATTQKPSLWFVKAIQVAREQKDLTGKPVVKVLDVSYYPYYSSGQYDVYVTAQMKVSSVGKKGTYNFNRETIGVSSPIDLEFPNVQFSGTITALSEKPFKDTYEFRTIYLTKRVPFPWEYEQIVVGDTQKIGNDAVFVIVDKYLDAVTETTTLQQGSLISTPSSSYTVKARIRVKKEDNQYIFGEEYPIAPGKVIQGVATNNFTFSDYYILKVE